jgi:MFS family permease
MAEPAPTPADASSAPEREPGPSRAYAGYVLGVLVLVNLLNHVDRNIVAILLQQIRDEFQVSDEWMGLLTGMAFMLVHATMGIPIALWADRGSRRVVLALGVAVWSAMTALSGLARGFGQLLALRMGVGIGEAAGTPPSHSMISDYFPPERRATALAIQAMGLHAGVAFGYLAAGWLGQLFGWRTTMLVVGLPGLALAALVAGTVREPRRSTAVASHPLSEVLRFLFGQRAYVWLLAAGSFHAMAGYSMAHWAPTLLVRVHGMSYGEIGTWLGAFAFLAGGGGALVGGRLADRLGRRDARWYAWTSAIAAFAALPCGVGLTLLPSPVAAVACYAPQIFATALYNGPIYAMNQGLARPRMRAMAVAVHLFVVSIVGGGVGPWLVGRASDALRAAHGELGIRFALLGVFATGVAVAGVFYLLAARTLARDFETARS